MNTMFERLDVWFNDDPESSDGKPFMFAVRGAVGFKSGFDTEDWHFVWLSLEEAEKVYNYLGNHIKALKEQEES